MSAAPRRAQAATATFSEWMDVASRLAGKSSQTLMTLLKGQ